MELSLDNDEIRRVIEFRSSLRSSSKKRPKKKGKKTKKRSLRERNRVNCHQHRESFERTLREALEKMANETK